MKHYLLSITLFFFLIGCGGGSSTTSSTTETTNNTAGIVSDPYIIGATFYWDKNNNNIYDEGEPISSASNEKGEYSFDIVIPDGETIIMLEKGTHLGVPYTGKLKAKIGNCNNATPLNTHNINDPDGDIVTLLNNLSINISSEDICKDPMVENDSELLKGTLTVDAFLKLLDDENIVKDSTTLGKIATLIKTSIDNNITIENIENSVKIVNYIVQRSKREKALTTLTNLQNQTTFNTTQNTLKNLSQSEVTVLENIDSNGDVSYQYDIFDGKSFNFSSKPFTNSEFNISLDIAIDGVDINWSITNPNNQITSFSNQSTITYTPSIRGLHTLKVTAQTGNAIASKTTVFNVIDDVPITLSDVTYVNKDTNQTIGYINNQSWVSSKTLSESELRTLVSNYTSLTAVLYDSNKGLLVTYTPEIVAKKDLAILALEIGIDKVYHRVYANDNAYKSFTITPDDNGAFNDGGTNWHLEVINMPDAWEYSKGSEDLLIGVSDGGYDTKHDDLENRFAAILTTAASDHGMAVTGAMAANTDNGIGISGINWYSDVVASYMGGNYIEDIINTKQDNKEVQVVNNSWGYHIDYDFDPTNTTQANERFESQQYIFADIRQIIETYNTKSFVFAAGNGIYNGLGYNGVYGVDAKFENGAIHYKNNILDKLDNLLVVGAINENKVLRYYSAYGESVDIASPSHYTSLALNNTLYSNFGGTSAAAPVVSSVISLIKSINPKLTPLQIKQILIDSATEYITQREINPAGEKEYLIHPIPLLNAKTALANAYATIETGVTVQTKLSDIINPKLVLEYFPASVNYTIEEVSVDIQSSSSQSNYTTYSSDYSSTNTLEINLDPSKRYHKIIASIKLKSLATGSITTTSLIHYYSYSDITLKTIDNISLEILPTIALQIARLDSNDSIVLSTTNSDGILKIYTETGTYRVATTHIADYRDSSKDISIKADYSINIDIPLTPTVINKQGSLSGYIYDQNGAPLSNASVSISAGIYTNGVFATAITDENGYYKFTSISLMMPPEYQNEDNTSEIDSFTLEVSHDGYASYSRDGVIILDGKETTQNFYLIDSDAVITYNEDVESDVSNWTMSGLWNKKDLSLSTTNILTKPLYNVYVYDPTIDLYHTILNHNKPVVSLAPDDDSNGTLPNPQNGQYAFWFGNNSYGAYLNNFNSNDNQTEGGIDTVKSSGALTSPIISIPSEYNSTLSFDTWWEIESVNPNNNGYDLMNVYIIEEGVNYTYDSKCYGSSTQPWNIISESDTKYQEIEQQYKLSYVPNWSMKYKFLKSLWWMKCNTTTESNEIGELVKKLNPAIDPAIESGYTLVQSEAIRRDIPFSSGGFNRKPVWTTHKIDLSKYAGKNIQIKFKFDTVDTMFNGFRGWLIDNIKVEKSQ